MNQPIVFLDGRYLPQDEARVNVFDRGFIFADGVYEVTRYYNTQPVAMDAHLERLHYSLGQLRIALPDGVDLPAISDELIRRNSLSDASVYWQVTRGVADREHAFPQPPVTPTIFAAAHPEPPLRTEESPLMLRAITHEDTRWTRCAIKSIALLPNVLARQAAVDASADEAILHRDHIITEGTSRSILIAERGRILTHPLDGSILGSITRQIVLDLARKGGLTVVEEPFPLDRLMNADEVIALGTTTDVAAIVEVDHRTIANGKPGPVTSQLDQAYRRFVRRSCEIE
jgi:D-alanine transaminase